MYICSLPRWAEPKNDGGSRVLGYELEARHAKEPQWFKAGEVSKTFNMKKYILLYL